MCTCSGSHYNADMRGIQQILVANWDSGQWAVKWTISLQWTIEKQCRDQGVWKRGETDNKLVMETVGFNFVSSCVEMQAKGGKPDV